MKRLKKTFLKTPPIYKNNYSGGKTCLKKLSLSVVSEKERDLYRVPSYGYII